MASKLARGDCLVAISQPARLRRFSLQMFMYPPHFCLVGVGLKAHSGPAQDPFDDAVAVKGFIVEVVSSVGD